MGQAGKGFRVTNSASEHMSVRQTCTRPLPPSSSCCCCCLSPGIPNHQPPNQYAMLPILSPILSPTNHVPLKSHDQHSCSRKQPPAASSTKPPRASRPGAQSIQLTCRYRAPRCGCNREERIRVHQQDMHACYVNHLPHEDVGGHVNHTRMSPKPKAQRRRHLSRLRRSHCYQWLPPPPLTRANPAKTKTAE